MQAIDFIVNPISGGKDKSSVAAAILKYLDTTRFQARICTTEGPGAAGEMARRSDAGPSPSSTKAASRPSTWRR